VKRIGILGGTFNPIHIGHLAIAEEAREQLGLDKIIFVPCYLPPHKGSQDVLEARHRYSMVRLATKSNSLFTISDFEIKKQGKSYSIDTLKHFHLIYPQGTKFFFSVGSDSLPYLHGVILRNY
jgi:nicotinate-nucleotide adenylyltransferase